MSNKPLKIIKLGGSVITKKTEKFKAKFDTIQRLAQEILPALPSLVIIHGGGSFGHPVAAKYQMSKGYSDPTQILGFSDTHSVMIELNTIVMNALKKSKIPAVMLSPLSMIKTRNGEIIKANLSPIEDALNFGLIPVLHGDIIFDESNKFFILSGDQLVSLIAGNFPVNQIIFCTDIDGLYTNDPKISRESTFIPLFTPKNKDEILKGIKKAQTTDVTGGMQNKIQAILQIANKVDEIIILNANVPKRLQRAIEGEKIKATYFREW